MVETQVQIPDDLFQAAKRVAAAKEWSFAEIVRRGLEYMTTVNPPDRKPTATAWRVPAPHQLGAFLAPEDTWTERSETRES